MATVSRSPLYFSVAPALLTVLAVTAQCQSTPMTLTGGGLKPFFNAPHCAPIQHPQNEWLPDVEQLQPLTCRIVQQAPFKPAPHIAPVWYPSLPTDTSFPVNIALENPAPFKPAPHLVPLWYPSLPADSSAGTSINLRTQPAPFEPAPHLPPIFYAWTNGDTSAGTSLGLRTPVSAPFNSAVNYGPQQWVWTLPDTSQGTPLPLRPVVVQTLPFFVVNTPAPAPNLVVVDTSQSAYAAQNTPPTPPVPPPTAFSVPGWMGGGSPSAKHIAKYIDDLPIFREVEKRMLEGASLNQAMQPAQKKGAAPAATFRAARIPRIEAQDLPAPLPHVMVLRADDVEAEEEETIIMFILQHYADL